MVQASLIFARYWSTWFNTQLFALLRAYMEAVLYFLICSVHHQPSDYAPARVYASPRWGSTQLRGIQWKFQMNARIQIWWHWMGSLLKPGFSGGRGGLWNKTPMAARIYVPCIYIRNLVLAALILSMPAPPTRSLRPPSRTLYCLH